MTVVLSNGSWEVEQANPTEYIVRHHGEKVGWISEMPNRSFTLTWQSEPDVQEHRSHSTLQHAFDDAQDLMR